jgi:Flp pilus assembly protein TadD
MMLHSYTLLRLGRTDEAHDLAKAALEARPDDTGALVLMGMVLHAKEDYQGAVQSLQRSIELQPDQPNALHALAAAYDALGQTDQAIQAAREALRLNPWHPQAMALLVKHGITVTTAPSTGPATTVPAAPMEALTTDPSPNAPSSAPAGQ